MKQQGRLKLRRDVERVTRKHLPSMPTQPECHILRTGHYSLSLQPIRLRNLHSFLILRSNILLLFRIRETEALECGASGAVNALEVIIKTDEGEVVSVLTRE